MPLYEYECEACGERFELIRRFSDPDVEVCARCGKGPVRRLQSSPAFQFKGSGWYVTDYARKGTAEKSSAEKSSGEKAAGEKAASGAAEGGEKGGEKGGAKKTDGAAKSDAASPSTSSSSGETKS